MRDEVGRRRWKVEEEEEEEGARGLARENAENVDGFKNGCGEQTFRVERAVHLGGVNDHRAL
jgi:hypothetical protein